MRRAWLLVGLLCGPTSSLEHVETQSDEVLGNAATEPPPADPLGLGNAEAAEYLRGNRLAGRPAFRPKPKPKPKPVWKAASENLRPTSDLIGKCFDFPGQNFNHENNIQSKYPNDPAHFVDSSDAAVDFKLVTLDGDKVSLSELLKEKPVALIYGMYTCPAFQGYYSEKNPASHMSKYDEYALVEKYSDQVSFVHLYGPEPHPKRPDKNFDTGKIIEFPWSTVRNSKTWDARRAAATLIQDDLHPNSVMVLDNLGGPKVIDHGTDEPPYNPVWCTYGPGARQAFLIGKDGRIYDVQAWFHATTMAGAIEELLLLESGLANSTDLERFRRQRTEMHQAVEVDVSNSVEDAFAIQQTKDMEIPGETSRYENLNSHQEVSKARLVLDEFTSQWVNSIRQEADLAVQEDNYSDAQRVFPLGTALVPATVLIVGVVALAAWFRRRETQSYDPL